MADNESDRTISTGGRSKVTAESSASKLTGRKVDALLGTVFADRYTILEVLGRGGMGVVYKARHDLMDRIVAIKMMLPQFISDDVSLARFQREARAASKINHQNVIAIHDFGITPDTDVAYLVMDYVEGETLSDAIKQEGQLGVARAIKIFLQVCDALSSAHQQGIIHRDLKPGNIMLVNPSDKQKDFVKVLDFGVAKIACTENESDQQRLTTTGEIFGSPVYMSPEQCSGEVLDARSDIYALGCVIYETLTGKAPCMGKNALETISRHVSMVPPAFPQARPDLYIPEWIEAVVFKALEKNPNKRQQSMQELYDELSAGSGSGGVPASQTATTTTSARPAAAQASAPAADKPASGNKALPVVAAVVALIILAAGAFAALSFFKQAKPTVPAVTTQPVAPTPPATQPNPVAPTPPATQPNPVAAQPKPVTPETKPVEKLPESTVDTTPTHAPIAEKVHSSVQALRAKAEQLRSRAEELRHNIQAKRAAAKNAADSEPAPASTPRRRGSDYYDYAVRHENEGAPVQLFDK